jgi:predicted flap endonuclease-1-like 5' DNA nuclease
MYYTYLLLHIESGCWLWWLLGSLLPLLIGVATGYLMFSKYQRMAAERKAECDILKKQNTDWEEKHSNMEYVLGETKKEHQHMKSALQSCEADKAILKFKLDKALGKEGDINPANADAHGVDSLFQSNNLQIIEGIGPKVEALLHQAGIKTWSDLEGASFEQLRSVLESGGSVYSMQNPASWPAQAALAQAKNWEGLKKLQKSLEGGEEAGDGETPSKVESMMARKLGFSLNANDLQIIEGIGPKIEAVLRKAGILNRQDLAASSVLQLHEVLKNAGSDYHLADPASWPQQAALAAAGRWWELKQLQDSM